MSSNGRTTVSKTVNECSTHSTPASIWADDSLRTCMSTQKSTMDYLLDQMSLAGSVSYRKMFGEYAIYCDSTVVALVCNDELFVKPTEQGRILLKDVVEKPAYGGAKPYLWISGDSWDNREWLSRLIKTTADALPIPKPKLRKTRIIRHSGDQSHV